MKEEAYQRRAEYGNYRGPLLSSLGCGEVRWPLSEEVNLDDSSNKESDEAYIEEVKIRKVAISHYIEIPEHVIQPFRLLRGKLVSGANVRMQRR